jgi:hypothetical protein
MRDLQDMTIGQRVIVTFVIVVVILLLLAAFGYFSGGWDEAGAEPLPTPPGQHQPGFCIDEITRERVRDILLNGLDESFKDQVKNLMSVWLRDERGQPGRASVGLHNAARAFDHARKAAIEWSPPQCP